MNHAEQRYNMAHQIISCSGFYYGNRYRFGTFDQLYAMPFPQLSMIYHQIESTILSRVR